MKMETEQVFENIPAEENSKALQLVQYLSEKAINGVGPLSSAESLAQEYLIDKSYKDDDARVKSLINWEISKNFTTGFITGLGGLITLPVTIPASLGASWIIQARMTAAIAKIYGHDITEDRVKTMILLTLVGQSIEEVVKVAGVDFGKKLTLAAINKLPGSVCKKINAWVGFRLLTKAGEKGVINLTKLVPVVGGIVGGLVDVASCKIIAKVAITNFRK